MLLIGLWIGGLFGAILYSMLFAVFAAGNPIGMLWMCIAFCGVIIGILSMIYFDHAVIVGSSLAGAYIFGRVSSSIYNSFYRVFLNMEAVFQMNSYFISSSQRQAQSTHSPRLFLLTLW